MGGRETGRVQARPVVSSGPVEENRNETKSPRDHQLRTRLAPPTAAPPLCRRNAPVPAARPRRKPRASPPHHQPPPLRRHPESRTGHPLAHPCRCPGRRNRAGPAHPRCSSRHAQPEGTGGEIAKKGEVKPQSRRTAGRSTQPFVPQKDDPVPKRSRLDEAKRDPLLRRWKKAIPLADLDRMDVDPIFINQILPHERRS